MDYLRRIANAEFPLVVTDMGEINCAAVLHAAGYVCADFDPSSRLLLRSSTPSRPSGSQR